MDTEAGAGNRARRIGSLETIAPKKASEYQAAVNVQDAERRQMTVLFADMVDSTGMSTSVDPEDYREVIARYIEAVEAVVRRYDGYVANYLGDGILIYFGYPRAHEEDSRRACFAALDIVEAVQSLKLDLPGCESGLAVRVGIHTGTTVLGSVNGGTAREVMAVGETLNLAARLQTFADPNTAVASAATERLVRGFFTMRHLGLQPLRGLSQPVEMYQLTGIEESAEVGTGAGELSPLVGRDLDLQMLRERWAESRNGTGRVVVMTGDAGLGKSRMIRALRAQMPGPVTWLHCRSTPFYSDTPLRPVVDALPAMLGLAMDGSESDLLRLESTVDRLHIPRRDAIPLLAVLLGLPVPEERYPPRPRPPQILRKQLLELLVELLLRMAHETPLALILDDVHWMDDTTLELTDLLSQRAHSAPIFVLLAGRPGFDTPLVVDCEIVLRALPHDQVEVLARNVAAARLPFEVIDQIAQKAEGNPLYVEELTRDILEARLPSSQATGSSRMAQVTIPASLHELLLARLDRASGDRTVIQAAAVVGRVFSYRLLAEVLSLDGEWVRAELDRYVDAELLYQRGIGPDATYTFRHVLFCDAAYDSMTRRVRHQYHRAAAEVLKRQPKDVAPEVLAHHLTEAGETLEAVSYWTAAGQAALIAFALKESVNHLQRGLALLEGDNTSEAVMAEIEIRTTLGVPLMLTRGFASPSAEENYNRLLERCEAAGKAAVHLLFPALYGLWTVYEVGVQLPKAQQMGERLLELADGIGDASVSVAGHVAYGAARMLQGDLTGAGEHFERGLTLYDRSMHESLIMVSGQDCGAMCCSFLTWIHAHQGDHEQGRKRAAQSVAMCEELGHPGTWAFVEAVLASFYCLIRDYEQGALHARRLIELAEEQGMPMWEAQGYCNLGWAEQAQGMADAAVAHIGQGIEVFRGMGTRSCSSYFLGALAEAELRRRNLDEATKVLADALAYVTESGERFYEPELWRLHGELVLARGGTDPGAVEAAESFGRALRIAQQQQAHGFARRVTESRASVDVSFPEVRG